MSEFHAFLISGSNVKTFLEKAQESDSMGGNEITRVDLQPYNKYLVILKREHPYPFVIDELRKMEF